MVLKYASEPRRGDMFNMWHEEAKAHTVYFWSKANTKNGPAYLLAHGSDGDGNALVLINVKGLLLTMSLLVSNISREELNKTLTRIANSVVIKED